MKQNLFKIEIQNPQVSKMNFSWRFVFISPFCSPINRILDDFNQYGQDKVNQVSTVISFIYLENPMHCSSESGLQRECPSFMLYWKQLT